MTDDQLSDDPFPEFSRFLLSALKLPSEMAVTRQMAADILNARDKLSGKKEGVGAVIDTYTALIQGTITAVIRLESRVVALEKRL